MTDSATAPPAQKLSRYRSQRKAREEEVFYDAPMISQPSQEETMVGEQSLARSKSRYRRTENAATAAAQEQQRPVIASKQQAQPTAASFSKSRTVVPPCDATNRVNDVRPSATEAEPRRSYSYDRKYNDEPMRRQPSRRQNSTPGYESTAAPGLPSTALRDIQQPRPVQSEGRRAADAPPSPNAAPSSDQIRATKSYSAPPKSAEDDSDDGGCFGLFKRKRGQAVPQMQQVDSASRPAGREVSSTDTRRGSNTKRVDAPISAVNAGDRRVVVQCGKSSITCPVTTTTTATDIIKHASTELSEPIKVKSAVLLELFDSVGVQRPLRQYERIRDVMNSWDSDRHNRLILVDPGTGSSEAELSMAGVPRNRPGDESWNLSFSQKPGKWDKRLITVKSDGQLVMQKDVNKVQDLCNLCHLSDFDIYSPTHDQIRTKIKPPKKYCFAIKSQQKTAMFESTENFVHFFCTNEKSVADAFYAAVQGWRSWYLVNVLGEGAKQRSAGSDLEATNRLGNVELSKHAKPVGRQQQTDIVRPDASDPTPAITRSQPNETTISPGFTKSAQQFDTTISPERRASTAETKQRPAPVMTFKPQLADDEPLIKLGAQSPIGQRRPSLDRTRGSASDESSTGTAFNRTVSQRRKASSREKEGEVYRTTRSLSTRNPAVRPTTSSGNLHPSKPLVDLTPQYREPSQHTSKGRAFFPTDANRGPLIDNATSPEDPIGAPPSTDWRAGARHSPLNTTNINSQTTGSLSRHATNARSTRRPQTSSGARQAPAFTGEGLLAGSQGQSGWGEGDRGRGVMDGSHAKKPMVDVTVEREFVKGSLLDRGVG